MYRRKEIRPSEGSGLPENEKSSISIYKKWCTLLLPNALARSDKTKVGSAFEIGAGEAVLIISKMLMAMKAATT